MSLAPGGVGMGTAVQADPFQCIDCAPDERYPTAQTSVAVLASIALSGELSGSGSDVSVTLHAGAHGRSRATAAAPACGTKVHARASANIASRCRGGRIWA
jgi:hypothetical protein